MFDTWNKLTEFLLYGLNYNYINVFGANIILAVIM